MVCHNLLMCGRYRLSRRKQLIEEYFDCPSDDLDWAPRYNIAPTQPVPVIRQHPKKPVRDLSTMKWGLIPSWAKDPAVGASMINARSETAHERPAFRDALKHRRCLIPADGFYEWQRKGASKQPFCFEVENGELFAFAGLWEGWKDSTGNWLKTCSILSTTPNAVTSAVHDRMPVILDSRNFDLWLDPGMTDAQVVSELLKPYDARLMRASPLAVESTAWATMMRIALDLSCLPRRRIGYSPSRNSTPLNEVAKVVSPVWVFLISAAILLEHRSSGPDQPSAP